MLLRLSQATGDLGEASFFGLYINYYTDFFHLKKRKRELAFPAVHFTNVALSTLRKFVFSWIWEPMYFHFISPYMTFCIVIVLNLFCRTYKTSLSLHLISSLLSPTLTLSLFFSAMLSPLIYEVLYASHPHLCSCLQVHPIVSLSFIKPFSLFSISTLTSLFLS